VDVIFSSVVQTNVNTLSSQVSSLASENKSALDAEVLARQQLSTSTDSRFVASNALIAQNTASITSNYNTELAARTAADTALEQKIASEKAISAAAVAQEATSRAAADTALEQKIASEKAVSAAAVAQEAISRTAADTALENKIADEKKVSAAAVAQEATVRLSGDDALNSKIDSVVSQVNANLRTKLAVSDNYSKRLDGNFGVSEDSFLYIGDLWRIRANNSAGGPKKMQFEYLDDNGVTFKLGVPFIRTPAVSSAPYLVTPTLTSTPNPNFLISSNYELDPALWAFFDGNQAGYYASGGVFSNIAPYLATSAVTFNTGSSIINGPYVKITLNEEKRFNYYRLGQTSSALAAYSIAGFTLVVTIMYPILY